MDKCIICDDTAIEIYKEYKVCNDEECKKCIDDKIRIGVLEG